MPRTTQRTAASLLVLALSIGPLPAADEQKAKSEGTKKFDLSIDNIMRGPGLVGYEPAGVRWSQDSRRIYFQWKQWNDPQDKPMDTYVVQRDGSGLRKLSEEEAKQAPPVQGDRSKDRKWTAYVQSGDIHLYEHATGRSHRVTATNDVEANPRFTRDGKRVAFTRAGNLYLLTLDSPAIVQITDIRPAGSPPVEPRKGTESQEFLKKEERALLEIVRNRAARREEEEARRKRENPRKPYILQARQTVVALQLSPDEKHVFAMVNEPGTDTKTSIVPNYVTDSAYTEDLQARNKVGDNQGRSRLAMIDAATGDWKWVEHGIVGDDKKERPAQFAGLPVWSEDGQTAAFQVRSADNKDRWIFGLDRATAKGKQLFHEHDDAWINFGFGGATNFGFVQQDVYFVSEKTGYAHLYRVPADGSAPAKPLTEGKWEVADVDRSEDQKTFFLTTSEGSPFERHYYSMSADGGARTKLTSAVGNHRITLSPDEKWLAEVYSYANKPPELYVQENRAGVAAKQLTDSPSPEFKTHSWIDPPIIHFTARDGASVPARFYKPANFKKGGPAVIFVHGAGYLQNVHKWWSSYFREYMFHHYLMERGFAVLDVDYRGSAGYGRDWRTGIYRFMGGKDLDDQVDGAQWMIVNHGVDDKRIGLYGGSYGGFITLMALFTQPGVFAAGAALRPVTDWAHYNHPYTSNILNTPQKDAEAYRKSSPIYHAAGLKGALLICHGMVDVNVHFQDSVRLAQKLIELRKENWEFAVYPVEDHGFVQPSSWADEYKRIYKLFAQNLLKN
jgi:dipeptidyl aminopeptidase/acylaminoacyl peptidase